MFKRLQEGKEEKMTLNHTILEDVRLELETSQDLTERPKLLVIKSLNKKGLKNLNYACKSLGIATMREILDMEYAIYDEKRIERKEFETSIQSLLDKEILKIDENQKISFFGDDFDKLYTKYFARESGISFEFNYLPLHFNFYFAFRKRLNLDKTIFSISENQNIEIKHSIDYFIQGINKPDSFERLNDVYSKLFDLENEGIFYVVIDFIVIDVTLHIHVLIESEETLEEIKEFVSALKNREEEIDSNFKIKQEQIQKLIIPTRKELNDRVIDYGSEELVKKVLEYHDRTYPLKHVFPKNGKGTESSRQMILDHCNAIWEIDFSDKRKYWEEYNLVNLGYIFMCHDLLEKAEKCFEMVKGNKYYDTSNQALNRFNYSVLKIKKGEFDNVVQDMEEVILISEKYLVESGKDVTDICSCLLVPNKKGKKISYKEITTPNIIEISKRIQEEFK